MNPMPAPTLLTRTAALPVPSDDRWILPVLGILATLSLIPVWKTAVLPLEDVPNHLLKVDLVRRYLSGDEAVRATYALNLIPFSNLACYVAIFVLTPLVGLVGAAKCFVSAYLLALPLCAYAWLQRVNPQNALLALVVSPLAHNLFLTKGNLNFCAALPLYLAALMVVADDVAPAPRSTVWFTVIATLLYFTHGVVFLSLGIVVGLLVLTDLTWKHAVKLIGFGPGLLCLALTAGVQAVREPQSIALPLSFAVKGAASSALEWLFGPRDVVYHVAITGVWVAILVASAAYTAVTFATPQQRQQGFMQIKWLLIGAVLTAAYLVAPGTVAEWAHLRDRFVPLAVITLLAGLRLPQLRSVRVGVAVLLVGCSLARTVEATHGYTARSQLVEEYVSGIAAIEPHASILPIYVSLGDDVVRTNLHSWGYYVMQRGGWSPYLQHQQSMRTARLLYPILFRAVPWAPDESQPNMSNALVQRVAACYDYVIMWGPSAAAEQLLASYYDQVHRTSHLEIWRNRAGLKKTPPAATPACLAGSTAEIGFAHRVPSAWARFETAPEKMGPPQRERVRVAEKSDLTVRPEEPPSSGGVSKGARRGFVCKASGII